MANYKIFCDESNHLLTDKSNIMVNGAILIDEEKVIEANKHIKYLRHKYNYHNEIKWTKLIKSQKEFYKALIDYFFDSEFMNFKATLVVNKSNQKHQNYNRTHDDFYYIVYYYTLRNFLYKGSTYKVYLDYKDTNGREKAKELGKVLRNDRLSDIDFYIIHSYESNFIQLCDLLIGAIGYKNRKDIEHKSEIKNYIIECIEKRCGYEIVGTAPWVEKFNIFRWSL
ncbi:DUF3800 domain-containing protein [Aliarcobacter butzleri]|uniref:DUF3800 domain-containing protein n=1 Tax=Aliarcobacter butzleri TaxID=28197 RepID=UPI003AF53E7E